MNYKAIVFDKDGTLIDFDAYWVKVAGNAVSETLKVCGCTDVSVEEILARYGVCEGVTSIEGILCKGTYAQMGQILCDVLREHGYGTDPDEMIKLVTDMHVKHMDAGDVIAACPDLPGVMKRLKNRGFLLAVVTTDNREITMKCLAELGIVELLDVVYTDDGKLPTKPHPACVDDLCRRFDLERESVLVVGDTLTDVAFAQNAGVGIIGVGKRSENRALLQKHIGIVLPDVSYLEERLAELPG